MRTGLKSPVSGTPSVGTAFGQLLQSAGAKSFYASTAVTFAYPSGKHVYAAIGGVATFYKNLAPFGKALVIRNAGTGQQAIYTGFGRVNLKLSKKNVAKVSAGQVIATSSASGLTFAYAPAGDVTQNASRGNPCGTGGAASAATISVIPIASPAVYMRFHTLAVNGVQMPPGPYPSGNPDVPTPENVAATVVTPASVSATMYEYGDVFSNYYVVLCGNAVFATGPARYAGPFTYDESSTQVTIASPALPPVVFFRDPGSFGSVLTQPLPGTVGRACPAPPPANVYTSSWTFYQVGQNVFEWWWCPVADDQVTISVDNPSVVTASPSPIVVPTAEPTHWPPPSPRADITARGVGFAHITVTDPGCAINNGTIAVTVAVTPTPAPVPTPVPN